MSAQLSATVSPAGGSAVSLGYDQANRLTSHATTATYRCDGTGLRNVSN